MLLEHRVGLVTGGGSGIGRAAGQILAREGASVALIDLDHGSARETAALIAEAGGNAAAWQADVTDRESIEAAVRSLIERFGRLDFAYNNAGIGGEFSDLADYSMAAWNQVLAVDLTGVMLCMKAELSVMVRQKSGAILNCSAGAGVSGFPPDMPALIAAKHGVEGLTKAAAATYGRLGIRVNAIRPGPVRTAAFEAALLVDPSFEARLTSTNALGRIADPYEIAEAVAWLVSDRASFVNGASLAVDGGFRL